MAVAGALCALSAPAALADVHVDPGGPAGKQYTAPLGQARQQASGKEGSAGTPGSAEQAPPFGQGVQPPGDGGGNGNGGGGEGAGSGSADGAAAASTDGGDPQTGLILGGALLVLLAGAGGGFALRNAGREPA